DPRPPFSRGHHEDLPQREAYVRGAGEHLPDEAVGGRAARILEERQRPREVHGPPDRDVDSAAGRFHPLRRRRGRGRGREDRGAQKPCAEAPLVPRVDRLYPCVEVDRLLPLLLERVRAALPDASERDLILDARRGPVDLHYSYLRPVRELKRGG